MQVAKVIVECEHDDLRLDRLTLRRLGVSDLNPTIMSRTTGEFVVRIEGQSVRYRYAVTGGGH